MLRKTGDLVIVVLGIAAFLGIAFTVQDQSEHFKRIERAIVLMEEVREELSVVRVLLESRHQLVTLTAYHPPSRGINSDSLPERTALMTRPKPGFTAAISSELVALGWLGKKVYIEGFGVWRLEDRMNVSLEGKHIDLCYPTLKAAKAFGRKEAPVTLIE